MELEQSMLEEFWAIPCSMIQGRGDGGGGGTDEASQPGPGKGAC